MDTVSSSGPEDDFSIQEHASVSGLAILLACSKKIFPMGLELKFAFI